MSIEQYLAIRSHRKKVPHVQAVPSSQQSQKYVPPVQAVPLVAISSLSHLLFLSQHNQLISSSCLVQAVPIVAISSLSHLLLLSQHNQLISSSYLLLLSKQDLEIISLIHLLLFCPSRT
jgi:hypothetical protein